MIKPQLYTAVLEDKIIFNEKYSHFFFELKKPIEIYFKAGQYLSLIIPKYSQRRLYSFCSSPNIYHGFELLINLEGSGLGRQYLQSLQFGEEINFFGPLGLFTMDSKNEDEELIFIGTGSGIAPLRSMILNLLQDKKSKQKMILYWGMRLENDYFWLKEFKELEKNWPNFTFQPIVSQPSERWNLSRGRVTNFLIAQKFKFQNRFFICGNLNMISETQKILLKQKIQLEKIHFEKFQF